MGNQNWTTMSPRGIYQRKEAEEGLTEIKGLVKKETFSNLSWWPKLNTDEQTSVVNSGQKLGLALLHFGQARLQVGEHLAELQSVLEPHNLFGRFLSSFRFSKRTAYRYIQGYKNASSMLPQLVLKAAMVRGVNIVGDTEAKPLGIYTHAVELLPPTKVETEEQANAYIDALEQRVKTSRDDHGVFVMSVGEPDVLKREVVRFGKARFDRLPTNKRTREKWAKETIALQMGAYGLPTQHISPVALPEGYIVPRGRRPNTKAAAA